MKNSRFRLAIGFASATAFLLSISPPVIEAQSALSGTGISEDPEFFITLDTYVKYGGDIDVIDGLTGQAYHSDNAVVKAWNGVVSPFVSSLTYLPLKIRHPCLKYFICGKPR